MASHSTSCGVTRNTVRCYTKKTWKYIAELELDEGELVTGFSSSQHKADSPAAVDGHHLLVKSKSSCGSAINVALYNISSMIESENASNNNNTKDDIPKRFEHISTLNFDNTSHSNAVSCELVHDEKTIVASVPDIDGVVFFQLCKDIVDGL